MAPKPGEEKKESGGFTIGSIEQNATDGSTNQAGQNLKSETTINNYGDQKEKRTDEIFKPEIEALEGKAWPDETPDFVTKKFPEPVLAMAAMQEEAEADLVNANAEQPVGRPGSGPVGQPPEFTEKKKFWGTVLKHTPTVLDGTLKVSKIALKIFAPGASAAIDALGEAIDLAKSFQN